MCTSPVATTRRSRTLSRSRLCRGGRPRRPRAERSMRRRGGAFSLGSSANPIFPGLFERASTAVGGSLLAARLAWEGRIVFPSAGRHASRRAGAGERLLLLQRSRVRDPRIFGARRGARGLCRFRRPSRRRRRGRVRRRAAGDDDFDPRGRPLAAHRPARRPARRQRAQHAGPARAQRRRVRARWSTRRCCRCCAASRPRRWSC